MQESIPESRQIPAVPEGIEVSLEAKCSEILNGSNYIRIYFNL
jgi:hypothetical protein